MIEPFLQPIPHVVAHRGDSHSFPENTLRAFESAHQMGVDIIETDVHLTKDKEVVIWHDNTLERNTNGSGRVEDYTLKELKELDAGYTFSNDGGVTFPFRSKGVKMFTLHEALQACEGQRFNVDLKSKDPQIVEAFTQVVHSNHAEDRVLCASFHLNHLKTIREKSPEILTSETTLEVLKLLMLQKFHMLPKNLEVGRTLVFQVPVSQWGIQVITPQFIEEFHKRGAIIMVWTINDEKTMNSLFDLGVDTLMSDNASLLLKVAKERKLS
jgi:glycerophosphoryl diester phosphodiesterase